MFGSILQVVVCCYCISNNSTEADGSSLLGSVKCSQIVLFTVLLSNPPMSEWPCISGHLTQTDGLLVSTAFHFTQQVSWKLWFWHEGNSEFSISQKGLASMWNTGGSGGVWPPEFQVVSGAKYTPFITLSNIKFVKNMCLSCVFKAPGYFSSSLEILF